MRIPSQDAVMLADRLLHEAPDFYRMTGRHTGIIAAHAEIWCGHHLQIKLAKTGVSSGSDGETTLASPPPFNAGETVQIKGRGSHKTMHITYKTSGIDWLIIVTYNLSSAPVKHQVFIIRTRDLVSLASQFASEFGKPALPVRLSKNEASIRVEWSSIFDIKSGPVKSKHLDTWEARTERASQVLGMMHFWKDGAFSKDRCAML
jgi:hypothetical protein